MSLADELNKRASAFTYPEWMDVLDRIRELEAKAAKWDLLERMPVGRYLGSSGDGHWHVWRHHAPGSIDGSTPDEALCKALSEK